MKKILFLVSLFVLGVVGNALASDETPVKWPGKTCRDYLPYELHYASESLKTSKILLGTGAAVATMGPVIGSFGFIALDGGILGYTHLRREVPNMIRIKALYDMVADYQYVRNGGVHLEDYQKVENRFRNMVEADFHYVLPVREFMRGLDAEKVQKREKFFTELSEALMAGAKFEHCSFKINLPHLKGHVGFLMYKDIMHSAYDILAEKNAYTRPLKSDIKNYRYQSKEKKEALSWAKQIYLNFKS